jgi:hypothetical protein
MFILPSTAVLHPTLLWELAEWYPCADAVQEGDGGRLGAGTRPLEGLVVERVQVRAPDIAPAVRDAPVLVVPAAFWSRCYQIPWRHPSNRVPSAAASLPLETGTARSESTAVLDDREARSVFGDSCFEPDGARRAEEDAECSRPAAV